MKFVETHPLQKHLFYGTVLVLLFLGTMSSVFRTDIEAKIISVACASVLFLISVRHYVRWHRSLP